jgi:chemotaxis signal transduction protein
VIPKIALFTLGNRCYSLAVERIVHILPMSQIFPFPLLRQGLVGLFVDHEVVVPLLDLSPLLGTEGMGGARMSSYLVVYGAELGNIGLPADKVLQMIGRDQGKLQETADIPGKVNFTTIFVVNGVSYPLLDIDALLTTLPD